MLFTMSIYTSTDEKMFFDLWYEDVKDGTFSLDGYTIDIESLTFGTSKCIVILKFLHILFIDSVYV